MDTVHSKYADVETMIFPDAITLKLLLSGSQTDGSLVIFEDIVEAGVGPPRHIHLFQDETFFFLEGLFEVELAGERFAVQPGDVAFIPKGTVHAFKNVGDSPGLLRYIFSPALSIEQMFREFYSALKQGSFSESEMAEIATKHGQEIVGPPL